LLETLCDGYNLIGSYSNGTGGAYTQVIEYNSAECGYIEPTTTTTTTTTTAEPTTTTSPPSTSTEQVLTPEPT
jgi:hypothetical protein